MGSADVKKLGWMGALLLGTLLLGSPALATDRATPAAYEDVEVCEGVATDDVLVNVRANPDASAKIVCKIQSGESVVVLENGGEWMKVKTREGKTGYVFGELLRTDTYVKQIAVAEERDPESIVLTNLSAPQLLQRGQSFCLTGLLESGTPFNGVKVEVWDERRLESEICVEAATDENSSCAFDLTALDAKLPFRSLRGGEKRLLISARREDREIVVLDSRFYVQGDRPEAVHMTNDCRIEASCGRIERIVQGRYRDPWKPVSTGESITIDAPDGRAFGLLVLEWETAPSLFTITLLDAAGNVLREIRETNEAGMIALSYEIDDQTRRIVISPGEIDKGLCKIRIYEQGKVSPTIQRWQEPDETVDLMVISAHQDDELLFFGGTIPYYAAQDKKILVVYMADCGRSRYAEALDGLWSCGLRTHPVFVGFVDMKTNDYQRTVNLWGAEKTADTLIGLIRKYQPKVIVTHDVNGEYGHNQHKLTSAAVRDAVQRASDKTVFPQSCADYGAWQVKKLYIHLYGENQVFMEDFDRPMEALGGMTPTQTAAVGFSKHVSQSSFYALERDGVRYDNRKYGLAYSAVGADSIKRDFFENIEE